MLINEKEKIIFIHNPKAGGTSISKALLEKGGYEYKFKKHDKIKVLYGTEYQNYFKFGVVRNVYEWLSSYYHYIKKMNNRNWLSFISENDDISFEGWLDFIINANSDQFLIDADDLSKGQYDWFFYRDLKCDYIIKLEEQNVKIINEIVGTNIFKYKENANQNHTNFIENFSKKSIELINNHFKNDFEQFNYQYL